MASKTKKNLSFHLFQNYSQIRTKHELSEEVKEDYETVKDQKFIYIHLLNNCHIHHTTLFRLLDIYKQNPTYSFSGIIKNPFKYVMLVDNIISFEQAQDIAEKYSLEVEQSVIQQAWCFDFILFKQNEFYVAKQYFLKKYYEVFDELCEDVTEVSFGSKVYVTMSKLNNLEKHMGDLMIKLFVENVCKEKPYSDDHILKYEEENQMKFTQQQRKSIKTCISNKFSLVCGYPGTGKSTIADCICQYYENHVICLAAPTGMAVNNLRNKCKVENAIVGTLHKLLFDKFWDLEKRPSLMIIDEFSMVDNVLFYKILNWCEVFCCKLILLADAQQLPPIGGGYPLEHILQCKLFKTNTLTKIKRQEGENLKNVILNMSNNVFIDKSYFDKKSLHFYNFSFDNLKNMLTKYDLNQYNCQIITPQHKHNEGTMNVNNYIQKLYTTNTACVRSRTKRDYEFRYKDLIVRTVNNYTEKELYANGDIGRLKPCPDEAGYVCVDYLYSNNTQKITIDELYDEFQLAYCLTVHKVQGSQYDNIILIMADNHSYSWNNKESKKLLYTAISRSKYRCFIMGNPALFNNAQCMKTIGSKSKFMKDFDNYDIIST